MTAILKIIGASLAALLCAALAVSILGNRACINDIYIGLFFKIYFKKSIIP